MSTIKATNFQHPSAASPAIVLDAAGNATVAGMGLVLVKPTSIANSGGSASLSGGAVTFTGATSVSLNGVFSSAYRNYQIIFDLVGAAADTVPTLRLRLAGTDNSASEYDLQRLSGASSTMSTATITAQTSWPFEAAGTRLYSSGLITLMRPNLTIPTFFIGQVMQSDVNGANGGAALRGGSHRASTAFDGFTLSSTTASTGTIRIYGFQNS